MALFKSNKRVGLFADVIRCDEPSYLIWKWHPDGTKPGEHKREYSIRWGSSLRVKEGEVAVFVYRQKSGAMQDFIEGPYDERLKTANLPVLSGILGAFVGGDTPFQAEVYFINLSKTLQVRFGVPYFNVCDPRYPDFAVPVAVRGTVTFGIEDYREFIKLHRLFSFNLDELQTKIRDTVCRCVKGTVANAPAVHGIPVVQIEAKTRAINDTVELDVSQRLKETFGVTATAVDIGAIEIDRSSDGYRRLAEITTDIVTETVKAQTAANNENYAETLRIAREEGQYETRMKTRSGNLAAYQIEKQAEVAVAGAEALGKMGEGGAGGVSLGDSGTGFNPAAMMAGIAVGGVVGRSIADTMSGAMSGASVGSTPPPITSVSYYVAKDGNPTGPFDLTKLGEMIASAELLPSSLVWKTGMPSWARADSMDDLKGLFPPPIIT